MSFRVPNLVAALALACVAAPADAAVFCVDTAAGLRSALSAASANGVADAIRLRTGTYVKRIPGTPDGETSLPFNYATAETLNLSGGWTGANGSCTTQVDDPRATVLDGDYDGNVLIITLPGPGSITVSNLSVVRGGFASVYPENSSAAVTVTIEDGANGAVRLSRVWIGSSLGRAFKSAIGLNAVVLSGTFDLENSVFSGNVQNHPTEAAGAVGVRAQAGIVRINNNTFVGNATAAPFTGTSGRAAGAMYVVRSTAQVYLANNVFEGNFVDLLDTMQEHDLSLMSLSVAAGFSLASNHIGRVAPAYPPALFAASSGNTSGDPMLDDGDLPLPLPGSPLIDAGAAAPQGGTGARDFLGRSRVSGAGVDRGAMEWMPELLSDGFEPQ